MRIIASVIGCLVVATLVMYAMPSVGLPNQRGGKGEGVQLSAGSKLTADQLAILLEAQVWTFDVDLPKDAEQFSIRLIRKLKGQEPKQFGPSVDFNRSAKAGEPSTLLVAIVPVGNKGILGAESVRVTLNFGITGTAEVENPFRNRAIGRSWGPPEAAGDGRFYLMGAYENGSVSEDYSNADVALALEIVPR